MGDPKPRFVISDPWAGDNYYGQPVTPLPGGHAFAMAWVNGNPDTFSMKDMTGPIDKYYGVGGTIAVTDRNGGFLAATRSNAAIGEVKVWRPGVAKRALEFDIRDDYPVPFGPLAFSPDGTALYVVTGSPPDDVVVFRVLDPMLLPSKVQLTNPFSTIKAGEVADVDVSLETPGKNRDVTLMAAPYWPAGDWQEIGTQTVDADGRTTFHVAPTRNTFYVAEYAGDAITVASGSQSMVVFVEASITGEMQGAFEMVNGVAHYHDADAASYAMHIEPSDVQQSFHVRVEQRYPSGFWGLAGAADVAADGLGNGTATFGADVLAPGRYRVRATSYGSIVVESGQSRWTRFVIEA